MSEADTLLVAFYTLAYSNGAHDVSYGEIDVAPGAPSQWYVRATMPSGIILGPSAHDLTEAALRAAETLLARAGCAYCHRRRAIPVMQNPPGPPDPLAPAWRAPCRWYLTEGQWRPGCQQSPKRSAE